MNYSKFRITLDIHKHQSQVSIPVMYGDTAVQLLVTLTDGGMPYVIGKSCWAQFVAKKPDGSEPLVRNCVIENSTVIRLDFDGGIADVAGVYECEIRLYGAEGKLTSPCFTMVVDSRAVADNAGDEATNDFIDQIGTTMAEFRSAEDERESAEAERVAAEDARITAGEVALKAVEDAKAEANRAEEAASKAAENATEEVSRVIGEIGIVQTTGESEEKVMSQKATTDELKSKVTEKNLETLFSPSMRKTKNLYNPDKLVKGKYCDSATGTMVNYATMDVYSVLVPAGYTVYCSCLLNGATVRTAKQTTRRNTVFDATGTTYISGNNSDFTSYSYKNSTESDQTVVFTIWGDGSGYTVEDLMIELFDPNTTPYISDYEPFGFLPKSDYPPFIDTPLHEPRKYFESEVEETVNSILPHLSNVNLCFGFVTDTHILPNDEENVRCTIDTFSNLKAVCERIPLDGLIHGGDLLMRGWDCTTQDDTNIYANKIRAYMLQANSKVFMTEGNHDGINGSVPAVGSLYGAIMSHNEAYVVREGNSSSYYTDFAKQKIRLIMLNTIKPNNIHGLSDAVYAWLKTTLESVPSGYNVIIASHIGIQSVDFETMKNETAALLNSWHDHTGDYTSNTGKIIAWIAGHQHYDWVVPSSSSGVHFPVVISTCSARMYSTPSSDATNAGAVNVNTRTLRSVSQDSWSVFIYREDEGKLYVVRFGAGTDTVIDLENWDSTI